jgi:hypothetical protein
VSPVDLFRAKFERLVDGMLGRATAEAERTVGAPFDERVLSSSDLVLHGEPLIALENLTDNLADFGVGITASEYIVLSELAGHWGLSEHRRALIDDLEKLSGP